MKSLPLPCVIGIAGVSFRQETVQQCRVGDLVTLAADPDNPFDPHAVEVTTPDGDVVGFVPKMIAPRLQASGDRCWSGHIVDVLAGDVWGLRVRIDNVQPVPDRVDPDRHGHVDTVAATSNDDSLRVSSTSDTSPHRSDRHDSYVVRARSGRVLGRLVADDDTTVIVEHDQGTSRYPRALVDIG